MMASNITKPTARQLLMQSGREILLKRGFRGLTVRAVASAASANLGSFVYHFGTRDAFVAELIEEWYAPLILRLTGVADTTAQPVERLRQAIVQVIDFVCEQDAMIGSIFTAALAGDASARDFLGSMAGRHPRILLRLIAEAQAAGEMINEDPLQVACFVMSSVGLPRLIAAGWSGPSIFPKSLTASISRVARDRECILQRLDWALRGLTPQVPR